LLITYPICPGRREAFGVSSGYSKPT